MKTIVKSFLVLSAIVIAWSSNVNAQAKPFKGIITYGIAYSGNIDAATAAQQPKLMTVSLLDNKAKMSLPLGPITLDVITDGEKKETITLIDMMGEKKYFKSTTTEIDEETNKNGAPVIRYLEETKTIAGYVCKKAEYVTKDEDGNETVTTVYYNEELGGEALNYGGSFNGLKGFPMEYIINQGEIITTFTVSEVVKGKVKATDFLIPTDYVELTKEEKDQMKAAFSGEE